MSELLELKSLAAGHSVLYVEDNEPLRLNATKLLGKFFSDLRSAKDGQEAVDLLMQRGADILLTDVKMPRKDGLTLIKEVKEFAPKTRAIIMSAFDEKSMLLDAIESGVFAYLKKPVNIAELTQTLQKALLQIKKEQEDELFFTHLHTIFNYQSSMVAMFRGEKMVVANGVFLSFFGFKKMQDLNLDLTTLGDRFLSHDGFLYNSLGVDVSEMILSTPNRLFHVKMQESRGKIHHFILKYNAIQTKKGYGILSFDDVTELNLLGLFDAKRAQEDSKEEQNRSMQRLLGVLQRNGAEVEVHNFYKGLSITNSGVISSIKEGQLEIKSTYLQLKSIQFEQKTLLVSELLPQHLECSTLKQIGFERQVATFSELRFVSTSAVQRKTIRVNIEGNHTVSLFLNDKKFHADIEIEDISLDAIRLSLGALPAGLQKDDLVRLDIVLEMDKRPSSLIPKQKFFQKQNIDTALVLYSYLRILKRATW